MKTLQEWLDRKPAGPAQKKPIARRARVKRVSERRRKEGAEYAKKRKAFLAARPRCEAAPLACRQPSTDVHHRAKRGRNYLDESTWIAVCRTCHDWIHAHPKEARELGLLA